MALTDDLVGRSYPPTPPYEVTAVKVREFSAATGGDGENADRDAPAIPPTFPIVLAFDAMNAFLEAEGIELSRIVHGDQGFRYARPVRIGDRLVATLEVASARTVRGMDIIGTSSEITDADGERVLVATATLIHRGGEQ
ncbi:MaoC family dehydratase N-terminal domain-containing protein [Nocardioides sp. CFH 31398]|uniref:FAS1-like dehydratase domain-containing protein n=1 Tax=Nocardioides sp. CFH 31398 TaxID=2919579 RepID=UPI001F05205D|nr:MaoC family dehydratase N-terminal domain-containing protein [Nocardioides sp. CFH 31398]MCH1865219.1 MaoC family dehydratase N-terminal domain-containing protein [Nocardioides sp. CFH 31398]